MGTACAVPRGMLYYQIAKKKSRWRLICGRDWRGGEAVAEAMEGVGPPEPRKAQEKCKGVLFMPVCKKSKRRNIKKY